MKLEVLSINARLDVEAQHDARALQDTELLRRDLNATFNDADRGVPIQRFSRHLDRPARSSDEIPDHVARLCQRCGQTIHPAVLRKAPSATLCFDCYKSGGR